jgi:5-deoxy-glucuronate isomerase
VIDLEGARVVLSADDGRLGYAVADHGVQVVTHDALAWLLVESGRGVLATGDRSVGVGAREDVFAGVGWSAYVGPNSTATAESGLRCIVVWRAFTGEATSRIIEPAQVQVEDRGNGAFARTVRTYIPDGPLIAGETLNPPGGWSSYPPHRHDDFEEAYLYRFEPRGGFGLAAQYDDPGDREAFVVHDGDVTRIRRGYHPVVAAPGYAMAYIWALAGDAETFSPTLDPAHDWVS